MSNLPNSIIRVVPPALRGGYCPESFGELAETLIGGSSAQHDLNRGTTFYNFGNQPIFPTPEPPPEPPPEPCPSPEVGNPVVPFNVTWEPSTIPLERHTGVQFNPSFIGANSYQSPPLMTELVFDHTEVNGYFEVYLVYYVTRISFPNLTWIQALNIRNCYDLVTLDLCNLITAKSTACSGTGVGSTSGLDITGCYNLTEISMPKFVPTNNGSYFLSNNDLTQQTVEDFLYRCVLEPSFVNGVIDVRFNNGYSTNGLIYRNQLRARGVDVR